MASTNQLQRTINYAQQCLRNAPLVGVGGIPNEPAFSIGDWVRQFILSAPFMWRWNRSFGVITTAAGVQDYTLANYVLFSNDFTNAAWILGGSFLPTVSLTTVVGPNGNSPVDSINFPSTGVGQFSQIGQNASVNFPPSGGTFTFSVWMKTGTGTATIFVGLQTSPYLPSAGVTENFATTATVTTTWQRFSVTGTFPYPFSPSGAQVAVQLQLGQNQPTSLVYAWGAQLEPNAAVGTFIPTTTAPVTFFQNLGFIEKASISDGTNQKELQVALNLAQDTTTNRPISISPYIDNVGGVTMRFLPVPDKVYTVNVDFQNAAPNFQNLTDTWAPIPDYYYYLVESGFLAKSFEYNNDERYATAMQLFVKQVVAASAGMADTQKNLYMDEFINANREMQSEIGNSQSGRQGRGLF